MALLFCLGQLVMDTLLHLQLHLVQILLILELGLLLQKKHLFMLADAVWVRPVLCSQWVSLL